MPIIAIIGISIGGLIALILLIGFFLPRNVHMERSIEIKADGDKIHPQLNNLKNFVANWSPWTEKDPDATHNYEGPDSGVGAKYTWEGDRKKVGSGAMWITESTADTVKTKIDFGSRGKADANFKLESANGTSTVTWSFDSDMGMNPISRYFGLMMDKFLGPDYESGLNKLKAYCETNNSNQSAATAEEAPAEAEVS